MSSPAGVTPESDPLLDTILNLARYHREHEKYYAQAPLEDAVRLQRHDHAADLLADSAHLVHDNEKRWRVFRARVDSLAREEH